MVIDFRAIKEKLLQPAAPVGGAQFMPPADEVMAHYNLSDDEWDCLSSFTKQKLATMYAKHAAAPAMYEVLQAILDGILYTRGASMSKDRWRVLTTIARQAIAQAEGRQG